MKRIEWLFAAVLAATSLAPAIAGAQSAAAATPAYTGPANPAGQLSMATTRSLVAELDSSLTNVAAINTALLALLAGDEVRRLGFQQECGLADATRTTAFRMGPKTTVCTQAIAQAVADARAGHGGGSASGGGGGGGGGLGANPALGNGGVVLDEDKIATLTAAHCPQGTQGHIVTDHGGVWIDCGNGQARYKLDADLTGCVIAPGSPNVGQLVCNYAANGAAYRPYDVPPPPAEPSWVDDHPVALVLISAGVTTAVLATIAGIIYANTEFVVVPNGATP